MCQRVIVRYQVVCVGHLGMKPHLYSFSPPKKRICHEQESVNLDSITKKTISLVEYQFLHSVQYLLIIAYTFGCYMLMSLGATWPCLNMLHDHVF